MGGGPMGGGPMGGGGIGASKPVEEKGPFAAGIKVFNTKRCGMCHTVTGEAPGRPSYMGPPKGPDLVKVGADPIHTREWLKVQIRTPKEHKASGRMPEHGNDKINDADLDKLLDYLTSLK
jgi:mono/diheme cytochrome c family protein